MKEFTLPMALADYVPVILFILSAVLIRKDLKGPKYGMICFETGALVVAAAGLLKAGYKMCYALNIGEFTWMSSQFFQNQAFGFLVAGFGLMSCVMDHQDAAFSFLPTMALVGIMVVGLGAMDAALCYEAKRYEKKDSNDICDITCYCNCFDHNLI